MKKRLKEVCEFYSGTGFPIKYQGDSYGDLPFYKVSDIGNNEIMGNCFLDVCNNYISYDTVREIKGTVIPRNVVVFAKIGEALKLNRRCITSSDCLIDNNAMGIGCNEKYLEIKYFYFFMKNLKLEKLAESTTIPSVRKTKLEELFIEVPNMELQLEIARTLEVIQDIILYRQKQLIQMDKLIKARFVEMFGDPSLNNKGYPIRSLPEIAEYWNGLTYRPEDISDDGTVVLRSGNIQNTQLDFEDIVRVKCSIGDKKYVKENDILMCSRNGSARLVGKVALIKSLKEPMSFGAFMMNIRSRYYPYLMVYFQMPIFRAQITMGATTTINQITVKMLDNIKLPVPEKGDIEIFATFVHQVNKSKVEVQKALDKAQLLFDSLMQKYFG